MRNLLAANFFRLRRSKCFWIVAIAITLCALGLMLMEINETYEVLLERAMFQSLAFYGVITAAFVSLFLGAEYGDGAIRNKLAAGTKRETVYLSLWLTTAAACVLLYGLAIAAAGITGYFFLETQAPLIHFLTASALGLLGCFTYCGLYSFIVMLCQNKAIGAVCCLSAAIFLLALAMFANLRLAQPPVEQIIQGSQIVELENPHYLTGPWREFFELLQLLNPIGQSAKITMIDLEHPGQMAACSILSSTTVCFGGVALFRRKDLK